MNQDLWTKFEESFRQIAHATGAYSFRVVDEEIELWRKKEGRWQIGRIVGCQVAWKWANRSYPPENTVRL